MIERLKMTMFSQPRARRFPTLTLGSVEIKSKSAIIKITASPARSVEFFRLIEYGLLPRIIHMSTVVRVMISIYSTGFYKNMTMRTNTKKRS